MDKAHELTDKKLSELEKEISKVYKEAQQTALNKANAYVKRFADQDKDMKAKLDNGDITDAEYKQWRIRKLTMSSRYKSMQEGLARDMTNANKLAASMINNHLPDVYATNYNWGTYEIEQKSRMDTNFMIYDRQTVERLIRDNPELLPMKAKVAVPKDLLWNKKQINNAITQGVLLGESIPDIAKRLAAVTNMNRKAAIRNARTMTTSAENGGRIDSYKRAEDMGIKITQEWLATNDDRTRHEHMLLNGQQVKIGESFKVDGYTIKFPGDPDAEPFLVYNCRCSLVSNFKGFDHKKMDDYVKEKPMSYEQWEKQHEAPKEKLERPDTADGWAYNSCDGYKDRENAVESVNRIVDDAPIEMQRVWQKHAPDLKGHIQSEGYNAFFSHNDKRVYFNGQRVQEGDVCHVPYQAHFHEFFHNIDYLCRDKDKPYMYFSDTWTNSKGLTLEQIIMEEWGKKFGKLRNDAEIINKHISSMISDDAEATKDYIYTELKRMIRYYRKENNIDRDDVRYTDMLSKLKECETVNQYLEFYKSHSSQLLSDDVKRQYAYEVDKDSVKSYIKDMREKHSLKDRADLSDMMQKFTVQELDLERPLGCGHDKNYFNSSGVLSNEAFAEIADSTFTNPASLELIKQELPETYEAWLQMLSEIIGG